MRRRLEEHPSTRPRHATQFLEVGERALDVFDDGMRQHEVEGGGRERQCGAIGLGEAHEETLRSRRAACQRRESGR
jgi:hypothetical protein